MKRKLISLLLCGAMVLNSGALAVSAQELPKQDGDEYGIMPVVEDFTAPELLSVSIDRTEVAQGEKITVTITATDDISGVGGASAYFYCKERNNSIAISGIGWAYGSTTYDEETGIWTLTGTRTIGKYEMAGQYDIQNVSISDEAGNGQSYYPASANNTHYPVLPEESDNLSFTVLENPNEDTAPPELLSVSIDKTEVDALGKISITITARDDISGVSGASAYFYCKERNNSIAISGIGWASGSTSYDEENDIWTLTGTRTIDKYELGGQYDIQNVSISDEAGNGQSYYPASANNTHYPVLPEESDNLSFTVLENSNEDTTPPELLSVSIDKTEVDALGKISITITARDDISGVSGASAYFYCKERNNSIAISGIGWAYGSTTYDEETGIWTLTGTRTIGEFELSGIYAIQNISISDEASNGQSYYPAKAENNHYPVLPADSDNLMFFVHNESEEKEGDIITSTSNGNLAEEIKNNVAEGGTANIYYGNDATLSKDVFEAVAGEDKDIVLSSDGIQWVFNGQKVDADKAIDLDLNVDISKDEQSSSGNAGAINSALQDKNSIIVNFADNGELPGPAKIRIKMDHVFKNHVGSEHLYVYYYDRQRNCFVEVGSDLKITDDSYLEFTITHNSDYVIVKNPLDESLTVSTKGDMNGDTAVDSADVNLLFRMVMDSLEMNDSLKNAADVNNDGKVNSADVNMLYRRVMGYL